MNKFTYWLRKSGALRTSSYKVSGDAEKLNKINASDGEMIQSQKEIDKAYKKENIQQENNSEQNNDKTQPSRENQPTKKSNSKVLFWIFLVIGIFLSLMTLMPGFSIWFVIAVVLWGWFLRSIWLKSIAGVIIIWKVIVIGIVLIVLSLFFTDAALPGPEEAREEYNKVMSQPDDTTTKIQKNNNDTKQNIKESLEVDKILQFFDKIAKEVGVEFDRVSDNPKMVWTNGGAGLGLNTAKQVSTKNTSDKTWKAIQNYFESNGATQGTVGMKFVGDKNQMGYYFTKGDYYMLMCVTTKNKEQITMSCGWGPGGGK